MSVTIHLYDDESDLGDEARCLNRIYEAIQEPLDPEELAAILLDLTSVADSVAEFVGRVRARYGTLIAADA